MEMTTGGALGDLVRKTMAIVMKTQLTSKSSMKTLLTVTTMTMAEK